MKKPLIFSGIVKCVRKSPLLLCGVSAHGKRSCSFHELSISTCPILVLFTLDCFLLNLSAFVNVKRSWICELEVVSHLLLDSAQVDTGRQPLPYTLQLKEVLLSDVYTSTILPPSTSILCLASDLLRLARTSCPRTGADLVEERRGEGGGEWGSSRGFVEPPKLNS